jgi:hypothetical protein
VILIPAPPDKFVFVEVPCTPKTTAVLNKPVLSIIEVEGFPPSKKIKIF